MPQFHVDIKGEEIVLKHMKALANSKQLFDQSLKEAASNSYRELVKGSQGKKNLRTGNTARAWTSPFSTAALVYKTENSYKTRDGQYNVARLIDAGHGVIRPKKAKMLYIPLTRKGQTKPIGAKTTGLKRGIDFILAKQVKKLDGTQFIKTATKNASIDLTKRMIAKIREALRS